jgi:hypothetical protein
MIDLKEAIERAKQFIVELNGEPEQFQVEEVILSEDKQNWLVTVSYYKKIDSPNELQKTLGLESRRVYKRIVIDNKTEEIVGLYNWNYDKREAA